MYAKYYFDLRSLAEDNGLMFPNEYEPLTKERAKKLEVNGSIINGVPLIQCSHSRQLNLQCRLNSAIYTYRS